MSTKFVLEPMHHALVLRLGTEPYLYTRFLVVRVRVDVLELCELLFFYERCHVRPRG